MAGHEGKESVGLLSDDKNKEGGEQADFATAVAAKIFGQSLSGKFAESALVNMEANAFQNSEGAERYIIGKGGAIKTVGGISEDDRSEKRREDFARALDVMAELEQQRKEWAETESTFGNITMLGADWQAFSDELRSDGPLRKWLIDRSIAQGKSEAEANKDADRIADLMAIQAIPPKQRTPEQQKQLNDANNDPEIRSTIAVLKTKRDELAAENAVMRSGQQEASVTTGADALTEFASAPDLSRAYAEAVSPTERSDIAAISPIENKPTPKAVIASGFDV